VGEKDLADLSRVTKRREPLSYDNAGTSMARLIEPRTSSLQDFDQHPWPAESPD
jgi:hypothetical protein